MSGQKILRLATNTHKRSMEIRHIIEYAEEGSAKTKTEALNRIMLKAIEIENVSGVIAHPDKYPPLTELNKAL